MEAASKHQHQPHDDRLADSNHHGGSSDLSPLEQEVLEEYERLARNMKSLSSTVTLLAKQPPATPTTTFNPTTSTDPDPNSINNRRRDLAHRLAQRPGTPPPVSASSVPPRLAIDIAESLRLLERKVASVYTLMKASVYSIVLQQEDMGPDSEVHPGSAGQGGDGGYESGIGVGRRSREEEGDVVDW